MLLWRSRPRISIATRLGLLFAGTTTLTDAVVSPITWRPQPT